MNYAKAMENSGELLNDCIKLVKLNPNNALSMANVSPQSQAMALSSNINLVDLGKKLLEASRNGETEEVRALMQSGAPFTTDWLGTSPLHFAAQFGHSETAEVLLRAGISRDARTKVDRTPLHISAQEGHLAIVSLLIMHGSDVDAKDMLRMTPLHWAVERGHTDVVECLLSNGADINITSKFEKTPIDIAYDNGRLEMVPTLQKYVGIARPKADPKPTSAPAVKMRPIVLPNKANRTSKSPKNYLHTNKPVFPTGVNWKREDGNTANPVLATLAALAAAGSGCSVGDALQWLESQGISVNSSATDSAIFQNAFESGQTMSLTEAGKQALNFVKDQHLQRPTQSVTTSANTNANSKLITIVADSAQLPQIINSSSATPIVVVSGSQDSHEMQSQKLTLNRKNTNTIYTKIQNKPLTTTTARINSISKAPNISSIKHVVISNSSTDSSFDDIVKERDRLSHELKTTKQLLEEYKNQLLEKDKQLEKNRQELEKLRAIHK
ncbi:unnamed protein product [Medioppia subpectinata]|uniref:Uncharacterized protein n=1 Tax=Medioppia subpectinata TaxID=1979941 RepID=A0A7R9KFZ8_9ACAR|nr:unnamed protein product [Medioppia subpectinata]CAG2101639.1 unnamed protein product [Medioppia subpectinata]